MFLVKFRATEDVDWVPIKWKSFISEEYVDTNDIDYAYKRAYDELVKMLQNKEQEPYKIELIKIERIQAIK